MTGDDRTYGVAHVDEDGDVIYTNEAEDKAAAFATTAFCHGTGVECFVVRRPTRADWTPA